VQAGMCRSIRILSISRAGILKSISPVTGTGSSGPCGQRDPRQGGVPEFRCGTGNTSCPLQEYPGQGIPVQENKGYLPER